MEWIGQVVIYIVMACAVAGALAAIKNDEQGLGREFMEGVRSIGHIFIPVAGIMASIPYLSQITEFLVGPMFAAIGADPAIAATSFIAVDMGGYQLAEALAQSKEGWIIAMITGYMAGATIVFSIPVGLAMLRKDDHPYMALGIMSGILSIPVGVASSLLLIMLFNPEIRGIVSTNTVSDTELLLSVTVIFKNCLPLILFVSLIAVGLSKAPELMIKGFMAFGRMMDAAIKLVLVFSIVEYFTGFMSIALGHWGFDPIIADQADQFRALEIAGYIGIMLSGAFPMVYLINKHFARPMRWVGERIGLEAQGAAGLLASIANILAMFRLIKSMKPKDKVINIAFAVCAAFLLGDHLAFTANFQPNLIAPILMGKLIGGATGILFAYKLSIPKLDAIKQETHTFNGEIVKEI